MIETATGDIFQADAEALVNPVNCVGIAGRGLAERFKHEFPNNYWEYKDFCRQGNAKPGTLYVWDESGVRSRWIVNFPTKRDWRDPSRLEDIEAGLIALVRAIGWYDIASIAMPALGCGLGGLKWLDVRPMIEKYLGDLSHATLDHVYPVKVLVYEPQ